MIDQDKTNDTNELTLKRKAESAIEERFDEEDEDVNYKVKR